MRSWVVVALAACGSATPAAAPGPGPASASASASASAAAAKAADGPCEKLPFPATIPVAEASGAALIGEGLIVVGDSGNHGEYVIIDPDSGATREQGHLPLPDGVSDDIEGVSSPDGHAIYGLVSDGTLLQWSRRDKTFALDASSRIGDARDANYEGLCLRPAAAPKPDGACDGYAASKADGHLYCLRGGTIDPKTAPIAVTRKSSLADCAFTPDGREVLAGGNVFAADMVWRVDPATGAKTELGLLGPGNGEVVLPGPGGTVWRFSDLNDSPSLAAKYRCPAIAR
jgi:hypothetical protein